MKALHRQVKPILLTSILATSLLPSSLSVQAQAESTSQVETTLNKIPDLSQPILVVPTLESQPDVVMPQDYPTDLVGVAEAARSYVAIDQASNQIILSQDAYTPYPIASLSKVISTYMVYSAIEAGQVKLDDKVTPSQELVDALSNNPNLTAVGLEAGAQYTVKDLLYAMMMVSGNDATTALLSHIYGSEPQAIEAIRQQLDTWGIEHYQFYTTSGIPVSYLPQSMRIAGSNDASENQLSAADLAYITQLTIEAYPQILEITQAKDYIFAKGTPQEKTLTNYNPLLPGNEIGRDGITGLKSGYTDAAGKCLITTTTENGRQLIVVVMGVQGEASSYSQTATILEALAQHPDLYQLTGLTSNERQVVASSEATETTVSEQTQVADKYPNKRDSTLTNLMKQIFSVFN